MGWYASNNDFQYFSKLRRWIPVDGQIGPTPLAGTGPGNVKGFVALNARGHLSACNVDVEGF